MQGIPEELLKASRASGSASAAHDAAPNANVSPLASQSDEPGLAKAHDNVTHYFTVIVGVILVALSLKWLGVPVPLLSGFGGKSRMRRHSVALIGLSGSGKTAMFGQLTEHRLIDTRTSMQVNKGKLRLPEGGAAATESGKGEAHEERLGSRTPIVVDCPGHRRLREELLRQLEESAVVVVVVDAETIHDDRHEGAQALAELLVSAFNAPQFRGVTKVLFACTKRDEITSYSAKAVKKLLEAEIGRHLKAARGSVGTLNVVKTAAGGVATSTSGTRPAPGADSQAVLATPPNATHKFTFETYCSVPVIFADVSSYCALSDEQHVEWAAGKMQRPWDGTPIEHHSFNLHPVFAFLSK